MKAALASDLHLEFDTIELKNTEQARLLILSGDILIGDDLHNHPDPAGEHEKIKEQYPGGLIWKPSDNQRRSMMFTAFLKNVSNEFQDTVYVLGNHEYYHGKFPDAQQWIKDHVAQFKNIHVLEKESIEIEDTTFIGATLWTDFNKGNPSTMYAAQQSMNDYNLIRHSGANYRKLTPSDVLAEHRNTLEYIKSVVDPHSTKRFVMCGHHAPTTLSIHEYYNYPSEFHNNGGYVSDLSEFIMDRPQIVLWTHGHTHTPFDYVMGQTRVLCNPRGYTRYDHQASQFRLKFFDI